MWLFEVFELNERLKERQQNPENNDLQNPKSPENNDSKIVYEKAKWNILEIQWKLSSMFNESLLTKNNKELDWLSKDLVSLSLESSRVLNWLKWNNQKPEIWSDVQKTIHRISDFSQIVDYLKQANDLHYSKDQKKQWIWNIMKNSWMQDYLKWAWYASMNWQKQEPKLTEVPRYIPQNSEQKPNANKWQIARNEWQNRVWSINPEISKNEGKWVTASSVAETNDRWTLT